MIFIIKGFRTIVFIFIIISTMFRPISPPAFFRCLLSECLRRSLMMFIIKGFRTFVFIFTIISTTFRPICPTAFFSRLGGLKIGLRSSYIYTKRWTLRGRVRAGYAFRSCSQVMPRGWEEVSRGI